MEKLGMTHSLEDSFDHPALPKGHELKKHVLYRIPKDLWKKIAAPPAKKEQVNE